MATHLTRSSTRVQPQLRRVQAFKPIPTRASRQMRALSQETVTASAPAHPERAPADEPTLSAHAQLALSGLSVALVSMVLTEPAVAQELQHATEQLQLAEGQEFWGNIARYGRYFVTVMLGTGYVMMRPFAAAFKNPVSAILAIAAVAGAVIGTKVTLEAMLGVTEEPFNYVQGQF